MQKIFLLMSCLIIHSPLLFAASNSKDNGKNSKSAIETAAPAWAATAAVANTQANGILQFVSVIELTSIGPIQVTTPQSFDRPAPESYRTFGCSSNALHQHFCKETYEKQAKEFPIMSLEKQKDEIANQACVYLWDQITEALKQQKKITTPFQCLMYDVCCQSGKRVNIERIVAFDISDDILPHRPKSPVPDGYELEHTIDTIHRCLICNVKDVAHKHFKKK